MSQEEGDTKRSKIQGDGKREFGCPCGKTYLSYPALFTHVKQKHDGRVILFLNIASWSPNQT